MRTYPRRSSDARRRLLAAAALAPAATLAQPKPKRIGILNAVSRRFFTESGWRALFVSGLKEYGLVEGREVVLEERFADDDAARLPALAAELVGAGCDVLVSPGTQISRALMQATGTIPIVVLLDADPVANGLAVTLARPGRNLTGFSTLYEETMVKGMELLRTMAPSVSRIGVLVNPSNGTMHKRMTASLARYARGHNNQVLTAEATGPDALDAAFARLKSERSQALVVLPDPIFTAHLPRIAKLALDHGLPAFTGRPEFADLGGLFSYGFNAVANWRIGAKFIARILKGAKPAEMPFEQPTAFEFVVNLRTAKALGIKPPETVLVRATRVVD